MPLGASFFEDVALVEFVYLVFTRMPGGITVGDSGLLLCPLSVERCELLLLVDKFDHSLRKHCVLDSISRTPFLSHSLLPADSFFDLHTMRALSNVSRAALSCHPIFFCVNRNSQEGGWGVGDGG